MSITPNSERSNRTDPYLPLQLCTGRSASDDARVSGAARHSLNPLVPSRELSTDLQEVLVKFKKLLKSSSLNTATLFSYRSHLKSLLDGEALDLTDCDHFVREKILKIKSMLNKPLDNFNLIKIQKLKPHMYLEIENALKKIDYALVFLEAVSELNHQYRDASSEGFQQLVNQFKRSMSATAACKEAFAAILSRSVVEPESRSDLISTEEFNKLICPISFGLIKDPVYLAGNVKCQDEKDFTGPFYERNDLLKAIETYISDPLTRECAAISDIRDAHMYPRIKNEALGGFFSGKDLIEGEPEFDPIDFQTLQVKKCVFLAAKCAHQHLKKVYIKHKGYFSSVKLGDLQNYMRSLIDLYMGAFEQLSETEVTARMLEEREVRSQNHRQNTSWSLSQGFEPKPVGRNLFHEDITPEEEFVNGYLMERIEQFDHQQKNPQDLVVSFDEMAQVQKNLLDYAEFCHQLSSNNLPEATSVQYKGEALTLLLNSIFSAGQIVNETGKKRKSLDEPEEPLSLDSILNKARNTPFIKAGSSVGGWLKLPSVEDSRLSEPCKLALGNFEKSLKEVLEGLYDFEPRFYGILRTGLSDILRGEYKCKDLEDQSFPKALTILQSLFTPYLVHPVGEKGSERLAVFKNMRSMILQVQSMLSMLTLLSMGNYGVFGSKEEMKVFLARVCKGATQTSSPNFTKVFAEAYAQDLGAFENLGEELVVHGGVLAHIDQNHEDKQKLLAGGLIQRELQPHVAFMRSSSSQSSSESAQSDAQTLQKWYEFGIDCLAPYIDLSKLHEYLKFFTYPEMDRKRRRFAESPDSSRHRCPSMSSSPFNDDSSFWVSLGLMGHVRPLIPSPVAEKKDETTFQKLSFAKEAFGTIRRSSSEFDAELLSQRFNQLMQGYEDMKKKIASLQTKTGLKTKVLPEWAEETLHNTACDILLGRSVHIDLRNIFIKNHLGPQTSSNSASSQTSITLEELFSQAELYKASLNKQTNYNKLTKMFDI